MNMIGSGALLAAPLLFLVAQASSNDPSPAPVLFENKGQLVLAVMFIIGNIVTAVFASRRDERARKWLIEDRKHATELAERTADKIRTELLREADLIKQEAWKRADLLKSQIAENTVVSRARRRDPPEDEPTKT